MKPLDNKIEVIGSLIVKGDMSSARREIRTLLQRKIPLSARVKVAGLARRLDMPLVGIRLLSPIVRPTQLGNVKATPAEIAEYSACLTFVGAAVEAVELLKDLPADECPESLLFRSFAHFAEWEYGATIPLLKKYILSPTLSDYSRAIGKINLLAALVYERQFSEALELREQLAEECVRNGYHRLLGNCHELAASIFVQQRKVAETRKTLAQAIEMAKSNTTLDIFYAQKWGVVLDFILKPKEEKTLSALHGIRAEAQRRQLWETVRQCDAYEAIYSKQVSLLSRVYFGTPYPKFREQILSDYGTVDMPTEYVVHLGKGSAASLDLATGIYMAAGGKKSERLKPLKTCHRLLNILFSDLYKPLRVAVAHQSLFPGDYFNPDSSPHRVHEAVRRLRANLSQLGVPLVITEKDGFYKASAKTSLDVRLSAVQPNAPEITELRLLEQKWTNGPFTVQECLKTLNVSKRSAVRILNRLRESGLVSREGVGTSTRYKIRSR